MLCLLVGPSYVTAYPALLIENADETWRCICTDSVSPLRQLEPLPDAVLIFDSQSSPVILEALQNAPPIPAPWVICCGWTAPACDLSLDIHAVDRLPETLAALDASGVLPHLCAAQFPRAAATAADMLHTLTLRPRLGAWCFLPQMIATTALHPALLSRISSVLYPIVGAQYQLTPAAVERRLRIAIESAWSTSPLMVLEQFFGQSIDPSKGKPTNREFLCQMAEHVRLALLHDQ